MGHNVSRLDPARIGTPYHPMQVGPAYISPSPQPVSSNQLYIYKKIYIYTDINFKMLFICTYWLHDILSFAPVLI